MRKLRRVNRNCAGVNRIARYLEEGEDEEPEEAVDEVEDEDLDDQLVLVLLHRFVVLEVGEPHRHLEPHDPVEQLEREPPRRAQPEVERVLGEAGVLRVDEEVADVERADDEHHLSLIHI